MKTRRFKCVECGRKCILETTVGTILDKDDLNCPFGPYEYPYAKWTEIKPKGKRKVK